MAKDSVTNLPEDRSLPNETGANHDVNALYSSLRLDKTHYQPFTRRRNRKEPDRFEEVKQGGAGRETRIQAGIFSPMGGSGKSMLSASLGSMLCRRGKRVLLVDTSPWQGLAFHYGAAESRCGMRSFFAPGATESGVHILAGTQHEAGVPDLNSLAATHPVDYVLFDLGGLSGNILHAYLQECDILLVPVLPDASALRLTEAVKSLLKKLKPTPKRVMFVLNQMVDSPLAKDVQRLLSNSLGDRLFPSAIDWQLDVQQALVNGVVLPSYAPEAQAVSVCNEIVQWIHVPDKVEARAVQRWNER